MVFNVLIEVMKGDRFEFITQKDQNVSSNGTNLNESLVIEVTAVQLGRYLCLV